MKGHVDHCFLSLVISGYRGACRPLFSVRGYIWLWRGMSTIVFSQGLYLAMRGHVDHCFLSGAISGYGGGMSTIVFCQWLYLAIMGHVDHCILSGAISGYEGACRPLFSVRGYIWL